jgi:hypothetical protein
MCKNATSIVTNLTEDTFIHIHSFYNKNSCYAGNAFFRFRSQPCDVQY